MKRIVLVAAITVIAMASLNAQVTQSPGLDVVGFGYDVFGKYADMASKKPIRLFELQGSRVEPIGSDRFEVPDNIYLEPVVDHRVSVIDGSSVREYSKNLSVNAGLKYDGLFFKSSVESNISMEESSKVQHYYYTYMDSNVMWRISMDTIDMGDLRKRLAAKAREDINNLEPAKLFAYYGTHYIASAYLGGRADYTSTSIISDQNSASSIRVAVEAEYKAVSGNAEVTKEQRQTLTDSKTESALRVVGGNARYVNNIRDYDQYTKWADGIETRPVLCDFDKDSLRPIWELADAPSRRQELENAFTELLESYPLPPELLNLGAVSRSVYMIENKFTGTYWDLVGYGYDAQTKGGKVGLVPSDKINAKYEGADRFIKVIPHPVDEGWVFLQPQHSPYVADITGGVKEPGAELELWDLGNTNYSVQFKMEPVPDEKDTYYIQSRISGLFLQAGEDRRGIVQMPYSGWDNQKWVFVPKDPKTEMAPPPHGFYAIQCVAGGKFWDFPGAYPEIYGKNVQLWSGRPNERSADRIMELGIVDDRWTIIKSRHLPQLITAGSKAQLAVGPWTQANDQLWSFEYAGSPLTFNIRNRATGEYMAANGDRVNQDGCPVLTWPSDGGANQKWVLYRFDESKLAPTLGDRNMYVRVSTTQKYLDLPGGPGESNRNGANAQIWDMSPMSREGDRIVRFVPNSNGDGSFFLQFQNGGKVLDVSGAKNQNGQNVQAWDPNGGPGQQWRPSKIGNSSTFLLLSALSNKALEVDGRKINDNGASLLIWDRHGATSQQFKLIFADGPNAGQEFVGE